MTSLVVEYQKKLILQQKVIKLKSSLIIIL